MSAVHDLKPRTTSSSPSSPPPASLPAEGVRRGPPGHKPIRVELQQAAKALKLTNTNNWISKVGNAELDVEKSYADNHLTGKVEINYGPRETGGGASAS